VYINHLNIIEVFYDVMDYACQFSGIDLKEIVIKG
jgi:hypothetical protein